MAIKVTDHKGEVTMQHVGQVLEVRKFHATRNLSDTLDYSDYQTVEVTEALVYHGRTIGTDPERSYWVGHKYLKGGSELEVQDRFGWVDCSNLFVWRGSDTRVPEVDADLEANAEMAEDLAAYKAYHEEQARIAAEKRAKFEAEEKLRKAEEERNRPVVGKKMRVAKGRKVPVGTVGTVAFVSGSGSVLLKDDDKWQDRKANGIWVAGSNLAAR